VALPEEEMSRLRRRGFLLECASMAWMTVEAAVAIVSGILAASIALIGFGLDSVIEFFAAAVVVWQLRGAISEERETRALRLIGGTFFALAAYLTIESITDLASRHRPEQSTAGIAVTAAALVVMPLLALAKRRTGQQLSNQALVRTRPKARSVPSPPPPRCWASGSTRGWDGGGPTRPRPWSSRVWQSGKASKPGRQTPTDQ
jgi:divalent metal cation (Fe/Co/Zn/Cd) transporter